MAFGATLLTVLAGIVLVAGLVVYFFGIPPGLKREMEKKALQTMGENKASYLLKDQISKMPESDHQNVKDLKRGLGNAFGGATNNKIGEEGGEFGDKFTSGFTDR